MTGVMYSLLSEKITKEKKRPKEIKTNENCWNIAEFTNVVFRSTHNNSIKNKIKLIMFRAVSFFIANCFSLFTKKWIF